MAAVLEVTQVERPVLSYLISRSLPLWRLGTAEQQEVAARMSYVLNGMDQAPPGVGEVEVFTQDLYELGIHDFASSVDLEQYWLDKREVAQGREAVEQSEPEVGFAVRQYLPQVEESPLAWDFRSVQPSFIDLGFKFDRLLTAESPRVRALYNKERTVLTREASDRKLRNAALREQRQLSAIPPQQAALVSAAAGSANGHQNEPAERPRPVGTAVAAAGRAEAGLSVVSRATYPPRYPWGVETSTGVSVDRLEPGRTRRTNVGGAQLMLAEVDGKVCAASRVCPHRGWDLSKSPVEGGAITCSLHGARYDFCSGAVLRQPYDPEFNREHSMMGGLMSGLDPKKDSEPLQTYPTIVAEDGEVRVHI